MSNGKETMKKKPCSYEEWVKFRERLELKKRKNISKAFGTPKINSIPQSVVNNGSLTTSTPREDAPKEQTGTGRVQMPKPRYIRLDSDDDESEGNVDRSEAVEEQEKQSGGTTMTSKENSSLYSKKGNAKEDDHCKISDLVRSISKESKEKIFGRRTDQINCRRPTEVASSMRPKTSFDVRGAMLEDIPPSTTVGPKTGEESIEQDFDVCREQPSLENMAAPERNITMEFVDDHLDVNREERENSIAAMIPSHAKETSGEKPSQTPDRHIIRPVKTNQSTPLVEKLFERHLLRFLKELDQGIPDDYIYEGRRIWTDLATRYKIRPDERLKFANEKCRFLKNLENEDSRPPMWVRDEQETLDLYYSVKEKFKDIIARRGSRQRDSGEDGVEHDDLEVEREETEEPTSIQPRDVSRDGRNGSVDRDRQVEATSAEKTGQELDSHSSRPQNSPRLQTSPMVKKPLFEKELMRFLKELDQGIPDAYISEGRRVWTDLASRYDIRQNRMKFADSKCRFLANLEDEYSRPPLWMAEDQGTLDLYYSVKQKFKDILARRQSDSDNDDETGPDEVVETEKSTPMQPREDNLDNQDGRNGSVDRDRRVEDMPGETTDQESGCHSSRPRKSFKLQGEKSLFEKELLRFLKELDQGIPEDYIYKGRRVWTDVATRYGIQPDKKQLFATEKCLFLKNLEDEESQPPVWLRDEQETLDLYYSVKEKFKDIIARRDGDSGDEAELHGHGVEGEKAEEMTSVQSRDVSQDRRNDSVGQDRQGGGHIGREN